MTNTTVVGPASSLQELCAHEGSDFIRSAYLTVLGRLPDEEGFGFYFGRLNAGFSKASILYQLRKSSEARRHDPGIAGFDRALKKHRRGNVAVIGPIYRMVTKGESDSPAARQQRALMRQLLRVEALLLMMHADLEERIDRGVSNQSRARAIGLVSGARQMAQPWAAGKMT
jgi:hypothetical protein